jgi:hypothetical protein
MDPLTYRHGRFMSEWFQAGRPYYNVYPAVIPLLSKISLDFPGDRVPLPGGIRNLLLKMPVQAKPILEEAGVVVRSIFLSFQEVRRTSSTGNLEVDRQIPMEQGLVIGMDIGETTEVAPKWPIPVHTIKIFPLDERNVRESMEALGTSPTMYCGVQFPEKLFQKCLNLAIAVCMLEKDGDILEPDYLHDDELKARTADEDRRLELALKARRRGKFGFNLGKGLEMVPHFRRPHPALIGTGKNRSIPKIIWRKGSWIHRDLVEKLPTGREAGEGVNP